MELIQHAYALSMVLIIAAFVVGSLAYIVLKAMGR